MFLVKMGVKVFNLINLKIIIFKVNITIFNNNNNLEKVYIIIITTIIIFHNQEKGNSVF